MQSGVEGMRRTLREREPESPSAKLNTLHGTELTATALLRQIEAPRLISLMKGDLDWIVMKALEKDRRRRYETANGLAMDLRRYLNNEPVLARPPSRLYRFQKLVRRNQTIFFAGTLVAISLIAGLGTSTWLFFREKEARHQQAALAAEAERLAVENEQAKDRESELRRQSEDREKIIQSAIYVSQEKYGEANRLLDTIKTPPPKPSYDGVSAYRLVGDWLALQGRWVEAAERYSTLMEIDKLDKWGAVTLDYQACGVVLVESGELDRYGRFCATTVDSFATTTNGDAAGRILKTILLRQPDEKLMARLKPLGEAAVQYVHPQDTNIFSGWAAIPAGLWWYRLGDYAKAISESQKGIEENDNATALTATLRLISAMAKFQNEQISEARSELVRAREVIEAKFSSDSYAGDAGQGFWYDWAFARILEREAVAKIEGAPPKQPL